MSLFLPDSSLYSAMPRVKEAECATGIGDGFQPLTSAREQPTIAIDQFSDKRHRSLIIRLLAKVKKLLLEPICS